MSRQVGKCMHLCVMLCASDKSRLAEQKHALTYNCKSPLLWQVKLLCMIWHPLPILWLQSEARASMHIWCMVTLQPRITCRMLCRRLLAVVLTLSCASSNSSSTSFLSTLPNRAVWASRGEKCSMAARMEVSHWVMSWRTPYLLVRYASRCCSMVSLGWFWSADLQQANRLYCTVQVQYGMGIAYKYGIPCINRMFSVLLLWTAEKLNNKAVWTYKTPLVHQQY